MSARNDYLPSEIEVNNTNGAGQGTPKRKAFSLTPARDPEIEKILQCRRDACMHPRLTDGACRLFVFLLDLSLSRNASPKRGVVTISATKLGECLSRTNRTIYNWTKELVDAGFIWTSKKFMPNFFPVNVFHIAALDPPLHPQQMDTHDGLWGNGKTRSKPEWEGHGRSIHGKFLPCSETPNNAEMQQIAVPHGKTVPLSTEESYRSQRKEFTVPNGKNLPFPTEEFCRSQRKEFAVENGKNLPLTTEESCAHKEKLKETFKQDQSRSTDKAFKRLSKRSGEEDFMETCLALLTKPEMIKNGGIWRTLYRQNPDKAVRVMNDVRENLGKIQKSPAKYAMDLWKRFK